jgi:hypothetical protein
MNDDVLIVPEEDRILKIAPEQRTIVVPPEWRMIRVMETMSIASKQHTQGDTKLFTVQYDRWLANTATIEQIDMQSNSTTCTVGTPKILGTDVEFALTGGVIGERVTVTLTMTDNLGNIKHDTVKFTVIAP